MSWQIDPSSDSVGNACAVRYKDRAMDPSELQADIARRLLPRYRTLVADLLAAAQRGIAQGDLEILESVGHKLKGSGALYGFPEVTEMGASLEAAAQRGSLQDSEAVFARLLASVVRLGLSEN